MFSSGLRWLLWRSPSIPEGITALKSRTTALVFQIFLAQWVGQSIQDLTVCGSIITTHRERERCDLLVPSAHSSRWSWQSKLTLILPLWTHQVSPTSQNPILFLLLIWFPCPLLLWLVVTTVSFSGPLHSIQIGLPVSRHCLPRNFTLRSQKAPAF